jgi:hypothetical protein
MRAEAFSPMSIDVESPSRLLVSYRTMLWLALLTFPFAPAMIFRSLKLASVSPILAGLCVVLSYCWTVAGPVVGWLALCEADRMKVDRRKHPQIALEAILGAITPPFFTFSAAALGIIHMGKYQVQLWYLLLACLAASRFLPGSRAKATAGAGLKRIHRISAILVVAFSLAHVINHLFALESLNAHQAVQNVLRVAYRQPVIEVLIVLAALVQIVTGGVLIARARYQSSTPLRNLHVLAGCFLAMFFMSHLTGVGMGRFVQKVDTTFAWATGGPRGLLSGPRSGIFFPYYSLSVLALFLHSAGAARWSLARLMGQSAALRLCYAIIALGILATLVLLLPMSGFHLA